METIVFLGDSITDANRLDSDNGLGFGYVNQISNTLKQKKASWNIINKGVDGFIAERLAIHLERDCIPYEPDYVSILVGINDVGIIMNTARTNDQRIYLLEECLRYYHQLLFDLKNETNAKVLTLEPFIFPHPQEYANWLPWVNKLSKQIQKLARNYDATFVPLHDELNRLALEAGYPAITVDGIHLTAKGHHLLAEAVMKNWGI